MSRRSLRFLNSTTEMYIFDALMVIICAIGLLLIIYAVYLLISKRISFNHDLLPSQSQRPLNESEGNSRSPFCNDSENYVVGSTKELASKRIGLFDSKNIFWGRKVQNPSSKSSNGEDFPVPLNEL